MESVGKGFVGEHCVFGKPFGVEGIGRHPGQMRDRGFTWGKHGAKASSLERCLGWRCSASAVISATEAGGLLSQDFYGLFWQLNRRRIT